MKRRAFPGELSWLIGVIGMALGVALVSRSAFGYSMIAAPVYLFYRRLSAFEPLSFLTFGTVEYLYQGVLLILLCLLIRKFRPRYLCSFVTAVIYGLVFDLCLMLTSIIPDTVLGVRIGCFILGELCIATAVVMCVKTDMAPAVYELFVKELAANDHLKFSSVKLAFDLSLLAFSILLSIVFFGFGALTDPSSLPSALLDGYVLEGIGIGTLIAALINGPLIGAIDRFLSARFEFKPAASIGRYLRY